MCSLAAAVQGMDETVNNGAQAIYLKQFNITNPDHPEDSRFSQSMQRYLTGLIVARRTWPAPFWGAGSPNL